jgi:peptide/nickel transport system substrate-binding protein
MSSRKRSLSSGHAPGWPLLALLGVGIVSLAIAWFAFSGPLSQDNEQSYRYVEAIVGAPSRVNPLFAHLNDADRDLGSLIFSGLTRLGQDGQILPDLAESWEVGAEGTSVTFHLRAGVRWHTGVAFTSADVLFTYSLLADPNIQSNPDQSSLWRQIKCSAPDDLTVVCALPEAFAPFLAYAIMGIIPKHFLEGAGAENLFDNSFNRAPVGTGPFRLAQLDQSHAILKPNESYYLGTPLLDEIELRFYPDVASASAAVVGGEAQGVLLDSTASQEDLDAVSSTNGIKAYTMNRSAYTMLYLNNSEPPLNDKAVRQAIAQTVDIDALISDVLGERAVRADSPIVPATWAYDAELAYRPRDLNEARDVLSNAGWALPEGADVRTRNSVELRITLMTDNDPLRAALAIEIADDLAEIGIGVTAVQEESPDLIREFLIPRDYQAAVFGFDPGLDPDPYPAWHSSQASESGHNLAGYASDNADELMEEARRTSDFDERRRFYYAFQHAFVDDVPSVLLYYPQYTYFVTDQVKGIELSPFFDDSSRYRNVQAWVFGSAPDIRQQ